MSRLRATIRLAAFAALTVPLMPLQLLFLWTSPALARQFPHAYHRILCKVLGVELRIEGNIPRGPALIVANHVSWLDIPVFSAALPSSFIAKQEVAGWPLFGQLARLQRSVFVDRNAKRSTPSSAAEIAQRLLKQDVLILFPEGTSHDGIHVLPFKSSYFAAAAEDTAVVPVTIAYQSLYGLPVTRRQMPGLAWYGDMDLPPHLWAFLKHGPVTVTLHFHEPLVRRHGDRKALSQAAETAIRTRLAKLLLLRP
jgi:lyso-ornithine lipid O-acyltransferase